MASQTIHNEQHDNCPECGGEGRSLGGIYAGWKYCDNCVIYWREGDDAGD